MKTAKMKTPQSTQKSTSHKGAQSVDAGKRLIAAKLVLNRKTPIADALETTSTDQPKREIQHSIPLDMSLVDRLIRVPSITPPAKTPFGAHADYLLSCDTTLSIWHHLDDAHAALKSLPLAQATVRVELPYFVLWALQKKLPDLYKTLIASPCEPDTVEAAQEVPVMASPIPYTAEDPPFVFKYGKVFGHTTIHPSVLLHTFITGATGAGKTYGVVKPLLQSFLSYKSLRGKMMSALVIDPKGELHSVCVDELSRLGYPDRLYRLGGGKRLTYFSNAFDPSVEERYRALATLVRIEVSNEAAMWQEKGNRLNIEMAECDRYFQVRTGLNLWGVVHSLIDGVDHTKQSQWSNILAIYRKAISSRIDLDRVASISSVLLTLCSADVAPASPFVPFTGDAELLNQLFYRVSNGEKVCADLGALEVTRIVNTDLFPASAHAEPSIHELLDEGKVIVLQPLANYFGDVVGKLVKSRFFADVLTRSDMDRSVAYVADEAQRFVTADSATGEASFMDRCRSFRVSTVLASQSMSSLELALAQSGATSARLVVDIIVANSPTRVVYRSLDTTTQRTLKEWIPPAPDGRPHVVDIRPVSQLQTGLAYYLLDGEWGMHQYKKIDSAAMAYPG